MNLRTFPVKITKEGDIYIYQPLTINDRTVNHGSDELNSFIERGGFSLKEVVITNKKAMEVDSIAGEVTGYTIFVDKGPGNYKAHNMLSGFAIIDVAP